MPEIKRELYVDRLLSRRWNGKVKIITGIRRCGKSYLLSHLFKDRLLAEGTSYRYMQLRLKIIIFIFWHSGDLF